MSSSDMKIIKDAKISRDPIVIAMHKFEDLDVSEILLDALSEEDSDQLNEALGFTVKHPVHTAERVLLEAKVQAETSLAATEKEVMQIRAQAMEEATELKLQALEEGKQMGLEEARRQMAEMLQQTTEGCNSMISAALKEGRQIVLEADRQIVELVMAISRKIIGDAMEDRPDIILGIVKRALERVKDQNQINIHVSLEDYERVLQARRELQTIVGAERTLAVTADGVLGAGDCLIETSFGTVEAGVDTQLESIRKALLDLVP